MMFGSFDWDNLIFEWDDNKKAINFYKYGIHFRTAVKVFKEPVVGYDNPKSGDGQTMLISHRKI